MLPRLGKARDSSHARANPAVMYILLSISVEKPDLRQTESDSANFMSESRIHIPRHYSVLLCTESTTNPTPTVNDQAPRHNPNKTGLPGSFLRMVLMAARFSPFSVSVDAMPLLCTFQPSCRIVTRDKPIPSNRGFLKGGAFLNNGSSPCCNHCMLAWIYSIFLLIISSLHVRSSWGCPPYRIHSSFDNSTSVCALRTIIVR